jgi:putative tributyrin esterase
MALMHVNFFSDVLGIAVNMDVIVPQHSNRLIGMETAQSDQPYPTLYLLHGLSDDHTIWQRRTSIERYVANLPLVVVMPTVQRGFYTDQAQGYDYFTFISQELPDVCEQFFHLSTAREDRFAAGLSMGGYGAMKLGLRCPDRYAAVASLSGALDIERRFSEGAKSFYAREMARTFGTKKQFIGSDNDLFALAQRLIESGGQKPEFFACCGTEDGLLAENREFVQTFGEALNMTYEEGPGSHSWDFWDHWIQRVLEWLPLKGR